MADLANCDERAAMTNMQIERDQAFLVQPERNLIRLGKQVDVRCIRHIIALAQDTCCAGSEHLRLTNKEQTDRPTSTDRRIISHEDHNAVSYGDERCADRAREVTSMVHGSTAMVPCTTKPLRA